MSMSISVTSSSIYYKMDLDLLVSFIVGPTSFLLVLILIGFVIKQFYANLHYSRVRQKLRQLKPNEIHFLPTKIPFTFELKPISTLPEADIYHGSIDKARSYHEKVIPVEITSILSTRISVYVFWGINPKLFLDKLLYMPWTTSKIGCASDESSSSDLDDVNREIASQSSGIPTWISKLKSYYGHLTTFTVEGSNQSTTTMIHHVEIPDSVKKARKTIPQNLIIPCVTVIVPDEGTEESAGWSQHESTRIKGLIIVLQLNSLASKIPVEIKDRFIKNIFGFSSRLLPLYLQGETDSPSSADTDDQDPSCDDRTDKRDLEESKADTTSKSSETQPFGKIRCAICQTLPVSRAILPCAHVCTCAHCFVKLKYCPICRGSILSFFKTRDESYINSIPSFMKNPEDTKPRRLTWSEYFEELNEQINLMLGLPEIN